MKSKILTTVEEMLLHHTVILELYEEMTIEDYRERLQQMLVNNYFQIAVFEGEECLGISGFWLNTKLWCGKYLELDNVIVCDKARNKGVGKFMSEELEKHAIEKNCNILTLDAYTHNFKAHKFYYNQGFGPKGFHFVKVLDQNGIR